MERRLSPVRTVTFGITLAATAPSLGWWPLLPLALAVIAFAVLGRGLETSSRPGRRVGASPSR